MKENEIIEGNQIIAEFDGKEKCTRCDPEDCGRYKFGDGVYYFPSEMSYHKSWDWLMPVVEKIEELGYGIEIFRCSSSLSEQNKFDDTKYAKCTTSKIKAVYHIVVEFIKWYNTLTTNQ